MKKNTQPSKQTSRNQSLWLCLYFFELPFNAIDLKEKTATVITEKNAVVFTNQDAVESGIETGMRLATVYALAPATKIYERNIAAEMEQLQQLAHWCYQFTPSVSLEQKFCLSLEISGSLKLFGGLKALVTLIVDSLQQQNYALRYGLGHAPLVAWLFSQYQPNQLDLDLLQGKSEAQFFIQKLRPIPLTYLDLEEKQLQKLLNLGLRCIGDLLRLPSASLGKRYGKRFIQLIDAIKGENIVLRADWQTPEKFEQSVDFANGLSKTDELQEPIKQLLTQFNQFLLTYHYHPQEFSWHFFYFKKTKDVLHLSLAANDHSFRHLLSITNLKLNQFQVKAPIEALKLSCNQFIKASQSSGDLFPELSRPDVQLQNYRLLLDKLCSRLGNQALYCLTQNSEHLPEKKQTLEYLTPTQIARLIVPLTNNNHTSAQLSAIKEPLWLMSQPTVVAGDKLDIVYRLQRIDNHWWQQRQQRDYFIAKHSNGSRYWVFQDLQTEKWFVHGVFG